MMFFLLCLDAVVAITIAVESAPPLPEKVRFKVASTQCFFSVDRQRASAKVVSTSIWKASAKYLHSLEAAAVNWPEVLRQKYGEDWNLRVYVDKSVYCYDGTNFISHPSFRIAKTCIRNSTSAI